MLYRFSLLRLQYFIDDPCMMLLFGEYLTESIYIVDAG